MTGSGAATSGDGIVRTWVREFGAVAGWQLSLRLCIMTSAFGALIALGHAMAASPGTGVAVAFMAIAAAAAILPDTHAGLVMLVGFGWFWVVNVDDRHTGWTLVAALCLAFFHTGVALASLGPWLAPGNRSLGVRWLNRLAVVGLGVTGVWLLAGSVDDERRHGEPVLFGLALAGLGLLAWMLWRGSVENPGQAQAQPHERRPKATNTSG